MERTLWIGLLGVLLCSSSVNSYSKYGRKCQDIGCRSNEECVMAEDPCPIGSRDRNSCGSYPTCARKTGGGGLSCSALVCSPGQYCKTVDGHPKCVSTTSNSEDEGVHRDMTRRQNAGVESSGTKPSSSGYPAGSGYSGVTNREYPVPSAPVDASGYPLGSSKPSSIGYPSYPSSGSSSYPAGSAYPPAGSKSAAGLGYPAGSGYSSSGGSGSPAGSGYSSRGSGSSVYPSYPSTDTQPAGSKSAAGLGYPAGSGYSSSGNSGYPAGSGYPPRSSSSGVYPSYPSADTQQRRTSASNVNAGYPNTAQYPQAGYPQGNTYPQGGYGQQYPQRSYGQQYPQGGYGQQYPQNGYQGQYPQNGYPQNGYPPQQKKPSIGDQLTAFAKSLAQRVLTQTIIDKVAGKS